MKTEIELEIIYSKKNIKIKKSYLVKKKSEIRAVLEEILKKDPYHEKRDRTFKEYLKEWRTHNILYHLPFKYFKEHCEDCDLSVNESKFRCFVYSILGCF